MLLSIVPNGNGQIIFRMCVTKFVQIIPISFFSYTKYITGKKVLGTLSPKFAQVAVKKYDTKITKYFLFNLKFYLMKQDVKS